MNKRKVFLIIGVMAAVLVGMVIIQVYWMNNAISLREQEFDNKVSRVLSATSNKLERIDAAKLFAGSTLMEDTKKSGPGYSYQVKRIVQSDEEGHTSINQRGSLLTALGVGPGREEVESEFLPNVDLSWDTAIWIDENNGEQYTSKVTLRVNDSVQTIVLEGDSKEEVQQYAEMQLQGLDKRKALMEEVMFEFMYTERPFEEKVDIPLVQDILDNELAQQHIETGYEFLIRDRTGKHLYRSEDFQPQPDDKVHRVELFPNDMFSEPYYLILHFPEREDYVRASVGPVSLTSLLLILLIMLCFAYTIYIIFRQKKLSDMKTDFINNMTHELKTPVATISLASEMLQDKKVAEDPQRLSRYARVINEENQRLGGQVEKVLQMAVIDKGDLKLRPVKLDVHELIRKVTDKLALQIDSKGGQLHSRLQAEKTTIKADEVHFTNVMYNLLDNAIKYSKDQPDITIATRNVAGGIELSVADKGIGMSREQQKKAFEKFYRVPTGNIHDVKGFGLGLTYVKAMVEEHGGSIDVKSEPGRGSTFTVFMPFEPNR